MNTKILLDLDGVIIDFDGGVIEWFNLDCGREEVSHWNALYDLAKLRPEKFWNRINTPDFWENLKFTPEAEELLELLRQTGMDVCLLSSPAYGVAGWRQNWIQKNLPDFFHGKRYMLGPGKNFFAAPNMLLIDDYEVNVDEFNVAGGMGVLYPQPWNRNRDIEDKVGFVAEALMQDWYPMRKIG